jgi:hypothetical protein
MIPHLINKSQRNEIYLLLTKSNVLIKKSILNYDQIFYVQI